MSEPNDLIQLLILNQSEIDDLSPQTGQLIYNSTDSQEQFYNGTSWVSTGGGSAGAQSHAEMYFNTNNTTDTNIGSSNTPVKIAGVTTFGEASAGWSMPQNNRLLWSGVGTLKLKVELAIAINKEQGGGSDNYRGYLNINGTVLNKSKMQLRGNNNDNDSAVIKSIIDLPSGQYIEGWIENVDDNNNLEANDFHMDIIQILT